MRAFDQEVGLSRNPGIRGTAGRPLRLLIVEDSDNERRLLACLLAQQGFDVHVARDGAEALEQIRMIGCLKPDVVLMDMQMPISNGLETLQRIREDEGLADLKMFTVTGSIRQPEHEASVALMTEPSNVPILPAVSNSACSASPEMKSDIVKPIPARQPAPKKILQLTPVGSRARPSFTATQLTLLSREACRTRPAATASATASAIADSSTVTPAFAKANKACEVAAPLGQGVEYPEATREFSLRAIILDATVLCSSRHATD